MHPYLLTAAASILVLGILIFFHELGHYIAAKRSGIKVLEFSIGFGPRLLGWSNEETKYSLRAIPMGGFCRMLGEIPEEAGMPDNFLEKPWINRFIVVAAGSLMNIFLAVLLFFLAFFLFLGVGDQEQPTRVGKVESEMPAEEAGLQSGDIIVSIDNTRVENAMEIIDNLEGRAGEEIQFSFERDGETNEVTMVPVEDDFTETARIGVDFRQRFNPVQSAQESLNQFALIFILFYQLITDQLPEEVDDEGSQVTGPVGIVIMIGEFAETGMGELLMLAGILSVNLGIINLLPIPALDGGRILFLLIEAVRRKPVDPEKEGLIHFIGFALLIMFILFITYRDLFHFDIIG